MCQTLSAAARGRGAGFLHSLGHEVFSQRGAGVAGFAVSPPAPRSFASSVFTRPHPLVHIGASDAPVELVLASSSGDLSWLAEEQLPEITVYNQGGVPLAIPKGVSAETVRNLSNARHTPLVCIAARAVL